MRPGREEGSFVADCIHEQELLALVGCVGLKGDDGSVEVPAKNADWVINRWADLSTHHPEALDAAESARLCTWFRQPSTSDVMHQLYFSNILPQSPSQPGQPNLSVLV